MKAFLLRTWAVFLVAGKRLAAQRGLALATALGLVLAVALTLSIPLYADAVYYHMFREELAKQVKDESVLAHRSAFTFLFRYRGDWFGPIQWEDVQGVDQYLTHQAGAELGLPQKLFVRHFRTHIMQLFPTEAAAYGNATDSLAWVQLAFLSDLEKHITLRKGDFPALPISSQVGAIEVLVSEPLAQELGLQVGEIYDALHRSGVPGKEWMTQIPIRIAGVWAPIDPQEEYWCCPMAALKDLLFVSEATFRDGIGRQPDNEIDLAEWYLVADDSNVHTSDADWLVARITTVWQRAEALLPHTRLDISPLASLQRYRRSASQLTLQLYAYGLPILALVLGFEVLAVGLSVDQQRGETESVNGNETTWLRV